MSTDLRCGAGNCTAQATVALRFSDWLGHVHNCESHAAINREFCDVVESAALTPEQPCPWPCTAEPIYVDFPPSLPLYNELHA